jgi:hypothetical protein
MMATADQAAYSIAPPNVVDAIARRAIKECETGKDLSAQVQANQNYNQIQERGSCHEPQHQEKYDVDQNFDGDRRYWAVKAVALLEAPFAGHEDLKQEMFDVIVLINEEITMQAEIDRLQYRDDYQGDDVQWVQPG